MAWKEGKGKPGQMGSKGKATEHKTLIKGKWNRMESNKGHNIKVSICGVSLSFCYFNSSTSSIHCFCPVFFFLPPEPNFLHNNFIFLPFLTVPFSNKNEIKRKIKIFPLTYCFTSFFVQFAFGEKIRGILSVRCFVALPTATFVEFQGKSTS